MSLVQGRCRIVPLQSASAPGTLRGWQVSFHNDAPPPDRGPPERGFIGTAVLVAENDIGAVPPTICLPGGVSSPQGILIEVAGPDSRGVATPADSLRIGVRGLSTYTTPLPSLEEGPREISLDSFQQGETRLAPEFSNIDFLANKFFGRGGW